MRPYVLGALLAGVLLALDFDPVDLPYSGIVGVAAFFVIAHRLDPVRRRDVALLGLAFGLGFMAPLIWWMHAVSYGAYVALVLAQALFFVPILFGLRLVSRLWWWPVAMPSGLGARRVGPLDGAVLRLSVGSLGPYDRGYAARRIRALGRDAGDVVHRLPAGCRARLARRPSARAGGDRARRCGGRAA